LKRRFGVQNNKELVIY